LKGDPPIPIAATGIAFLILAAGVIVSWRGVRARLS